MATEEGKIEQSVETINRVESGGAADRAIPARPTSRGDLFKRWLPVLLAFVSVMVALATYLQAEAAARSAQLNRRAQESAIASTGLRARGQQDAGLNEYVMAREYDELNANVSRLTSAGEPLAARAYITASHEITRLSPYLGPNYTSMDARGLRSSDVNRYEADTWVVTSTLLSQRRQAAATEANQWDGKGNSYVGAIAILAASLFLFGLASNLGGLVRWIFLAVGVFLVSASTLWMLVTTILPVHHIPEPALQKYAEGYGLYWQNKYEDAIRSYTLAIERDPAYAEAYNQRGFSRLNLRPAGVTAAIKDLEEARRLAPGNADTAWNLGWAYYLDGQYAKSIPMSQESLALNPETCGPAFNVAIARLASGKPSEAEKDYEAAIVRCEKAYKSFLERGLDAPNSLWRDMAFSADDLDNLLCQALKKYCYAGRDTPDVKNISNPDQLLPLAEKYRKRIREAVTALEYMGTTSVKPPTAKFEGLRFANKFYGENDKFQSYVENVRYPYDPPHIYALWTYSGMTPKDQVIWKVYRDGSEVPDLRYDESWTLEKEGTAEKKIDSWYILSAGHYDVQAYVNGAQVATGGFDIDNNRTLTVTPPSNPKPVAPVNVGGLSFSDDFQNNNHGWWTGTVDGHVKAEFANGEYSIVTHEKDDLWRVTCQACTTLDDLYYEVNTRYISGPKDWGYGIVARTDAQIHNLYLFLISADGQFTVGKIVDGKYVNPPPSGWAASSAIQKAGSNRLAVTLRGSTLEFFINGQSVKRLTDNSIAKGRIGLAVERTDLQVAFSQLRVWQIR